MARHIGHFGIARKVQLHRPCESRRKRHSQDKVFKLEQFGMRGEGQGVHNKSPFLARLNDPLSALRCPPFPILQDLPHGPARDGPDEPLLLRKVTILITYLQGLVNHSRLNQLMLCCQ